MIGPRDYKSIAKLLREVADRPTTSLERIARALRLAKHFEVLAADPNAEVPMKYYG
jgi:hypothetical protein